MADVLGKVKDSLGITGAYQDKTIQGYIDEVKEYMIGAGVPKAVADASTSAGVIARGVSDLWLNNGKLSDYFCQRVSQLCYSSAEEVAGDA